MSADFLPAMKASGLSVDSGWYCLLGGGPHVRMESMATSVNQINGVLYRGKARDMLDRLTKLVGNYSNSLFEPLEGVKTSRAKRPSLRGARLLHSWDAHSGEGESLFRFLIKEWVPGMAGMGLNAISFWRLALGTGLPFVMEITAPDLSFLLNAMIDPGYLNWMTQMEGWVNRQESRVLVRHEDFLGVIQQIYGRAIRSVSPDEMYSMVGPLGE